MSDLNYTVDFLDGARLFLSNNNKKGDYKIIFKDNETNEILKSDIIQPGSSIKTDQIYYKNWNIKIENNNKIILDYNINLKNKIIIIRMQSKSLGDTIAWAPYIEEFRKKHNCIIYFSTFKNDLFKDQYPNINFINPGQNVDNAFAQYHLGWFRPYINKNPYDYKKIPLQKTATDILGLEYKEIIPDIKKINVKNPYNQKYVCIAQFSTANAKHWHYPIIDSHKGWQIIVDWLNHLGYKVLVISKQQTNLKNIIDRTGDYPLEWRIHELMNCDFFIGVGSGLSWLAWALNKKVVMISGFSDPVCEFKSNNIRVINKSVCNSCFNKFEFDKGDWNWCPIHKNTSRQFECSRNITPKMVADKIVDSGLIKNLGDFDFDIKTKNIILNENDININYNNNRINIHYIKDKPISDIHINIRDDLNRLLKTLRDIELNKKHIIWSSFDIENCKEFTLEFFNNDKLLLKKILKL